MSHDPEQQPLLVATASSPAMAKSFNVGSKTSRAIAAAEAEEGPFPSPLKTMLLAEAFGTCLFIQVGGAAQCVGLYSTSAASKTSGGSIAFPVALVWGLALTLSVYLTAAQSGAHLNPAISFSFALVRPSDFRFRKMVPYFAVQLISGALAATINLFLFHAAIASYESKNRIVRGTPQAMASAAAFANYYSSPPGAVHNLAHALFVEGFGTAALVFCLFCLTHRRNPVPGAAVPALVGVTYGLLVATLGPLTGASLNPARDLGPRLVVATIGRWGWTAAFTDWLPYLIGPMVGGPIGAFVADKVLMMS